MKIQNSEQSNRNKDHYIPLVESRCGMQTALQVYRRIFGKKDVFYDWLEKNPNATKNDIRKKSHEIAGTLDEYERTANKRFYVIQAYRKNVETQSCCIRSFAEEMSLGANLMFSALEIADEMQEYTNSKNVHIFDRIHIFANVLQGYGVVWTKNQMSMADISQMDAAGIIALIVCTTWTNRLRPGLIEPYLRNGSILKWLDRLDELDQ